MEGMPLQSVFRMSKSRVFMLVCGLCILFLLFHQYATPITQMIPVKLAQMKDTSKEWILNKANANTKTPSKIRDMQNQTSRKQDQSIANDDTVAKILAKKVKILCWIMTAPNNIETRVKYVVRTWARRCDKVVIISSKPNPKYGGIVAIDVKEGRNHLTEKTLGGFHYVYKHHLNDADWFFKADDDTYAIMENMRYLLYEEDPNDAIYFGHYFKAVEKFDYSSGGSGLVISKEALKRFGKSAMHSNVCRQTGSAGDSAFGECMANLGVKLRNSTDVFGKTRFHAVSPHSTISGHKSDWLNRYDPNGLKLGVDAISDYAISFHYVRGSQMDALEYLIYHARPYGVKDILRDLNQH